MGEGLTMLCTEYHLAGHNLRNRICVPPMVLWGATEEGFVTDFVLQHYGSLRGGAIVVVEATVVSPEGRLAKNQLGAFDDRHIAGLSAIAHVIKENGALPGIQIHHAGRATNRENTFGLDLVAPSTITTGQDIPQALSRQGIKLLVDKYASAAARAVAAGFQLIEIHGAHGYLISQFLSPAVNDRGDEYGGVLSNRQRFAREVLAAVKVAVAERALVSMRLGVVDGVQNGLTLAEGLHTAKNLAESGLDLLHISSGIGAIPDGIRPQDSKHSALLHLAQAVKAEVKIPVIGVGGVRTPAQLNDALKEDMADLVAVGRGHLADPAWAHKACHDPESIALCQACRPCSYWRRPSACPARQLLS